MRNPISHFQNTRFKLLLVLLCCSILIGQAFLARPALAEQADVPRLVSPKTYKKPVSVSWNNPQKTFVFVVANSGDIWQKSLTGSTLAWSAWINLGVPPISSGYFVDVTAVSWTTGRIDLFGVDNSNTVWHKVLINTSWSGAWENIGGIFSTTAGLQAISWAPGRLDLFTRSTAVCLCHKWWSNGWGPNQLSWENLGNILSSSMRYVHATSWGADRIDLVGVNWEQAVIHQSWDGTGWGPIGGESLSGTTSADPFSISWGFNRLDVLIRGGTSLNPSPNVYHRAWNGTAWTAWKNIGGDSKTTPVTGVSWGANRFDIFEVRRNYNSSDGVYHKALSGSSWLPSATGWEFIGGETALSDIAATSWGSNRLDLFAMRNNDGSLWHLAWNGSAWTPSINSWELINP